MIDDIREEVRMISALCEIIQVNLYDTLDTKRKSETIRLQGFIHLHGENHIVVSQKWSQDNVNSTLKIIDIDRKYRQQFRYFDGM